MYLLTQPRFPAGTYTMASYLPSYILNTLLIIPHFLISVRNALLPITPAIAQPYPPPQPPALPPSSVPTAPPASEVAKAAEELSEHEASASDTGSEADVESNSSGVESSWVHA